MLNMKIFKLEFIVGRFLMGIRLDISKNTLESEVNRVKSINNLKP